jgi:two-component system response regulator YesN
MLKVLLAEDELFVRSGMRQFIDWEAHGFSLLAEASHGQEAWEIMKHTDIDILITDIRMPVMDGLQLIEKIRDSGMTCEIIILTSYDDFHYVKQAMKWDVRDYVHKPTMTPQELLATLDRVKNHVENTRSNAEVRELLRLTAKVSGEILTESTLKQALRGELLDRSVRGLLDDGLLPAEGIYLAILRISASLKRITADNGSGEAHLALDERILKNALNGLGESNSSKQFTAVWREEGNWILVFTENCNSSMKKLTDWISEQGLSTIWECTEIAIPLAMLPEAYSGLLLQLQEKQKEWEATNRMHPTILEALNFIHQKYMDNITLNLIGDRIHINPVYFSRLFLKETGSTFIDYLTGYRLEQAQFLLRNTNLRTYEISERVGYKNSKYFLKLFKEKFHMTPGEYRKAND